MSKTEEKPTLIERDAPSPELQPDVLQLLDTIRMSAPKSPTRQPGILESGRSPIAEALVPEVHGSVLQSRATWESKVALAVEQFRASSGESLAGPEVNVPDESKVRP